MKKSSVISFYGTALKASDALGIHVNSIRRWGEDVPEASAYKIEVATGGALLSKQSENNGHMPKFKWDDYADVALYRDIIYGIAPYGTPLTPTMYSKDGTQIYIKTSDMAFLVDDYDGLLECFNDTFSELKKKVNDKRVGFRELYLLELDYSVIYSILYYADKLPDNYTYPEKEIMGLRTKHS